jgi:hypothetical protein
MKPDLETGMTPGPRAVQHSRWRRIQRSNAGLNWLVSLRNRAGYREELTFKIRPAVT